MNLEKRLLENISIAIKKSLNEMARDISHRTIDRKLWLSVQSIISRNKSTEAEFIKPMKKLNKDDLLNRYVAALLIMRKPCPKNEKDIEDLKTLKLFAEKALELGATINDIQNLYDINAGNKTAAQIKPEPQQEHPTFMDSLIDTEETDIYDDVSSETESEYKKHLVDTELSGKSIYKTIQVESYGISLSDFPYTHEKIKSLRSAYGGYYRSFHLGDYVMTIDNRDIYVTDFQDIITERRSWGPHSAGYDNVYFTKTKLYKKFILKYINDFFETEAEAIYDNNGYENTNILLLNDANWCDNLNRGEMRTGFSYTAGFHGSKNTCRIEDTYIPALGELMDAFSIIPEKFKNINGPIWTSTFKDENTVYGYDGRNVSLLNINTDTAYIVPFVCAEHGNTYFGKISINKIIYFKLMRVDEGKMERQKEKYRIQDKSKLLDSAKKWALPIDNSLLIEIENQVEKYSDAQKILQIKKLLNAKIGNQMKGNDFTCYGLWKNNQNTEITGIYLYNDKLYVKYYIQGDSVDADDTININDLVGTHRNETTGSRFTITSKDKEVILRKALALLLYWDKQIKKYS